MAFSNIDKPSKYFNTVLFSGNSGTQSITGVGFKPDWVWNFQRSSGGNSRMFDAVRGTSLALISNDTSAEASQAGVSSFDTDGFTTGSINNSTGQTYVTWNWLASNTTASNTSGSITSTVSANTTSGFSIVSYTGTGSVSTVGHGLGVAPKMLIIKNRDQGVGGWNWKVYHALLGNTKDISLNRTDAAATTTNFWNNTSPTSSVFTIGTDGVVNTNGNKFIAYCFAEIKGFSKFGSYTGNGSSDGTFIYTGFKPAYVMIKNSTFASQSWWISDNKRTPYNVASTTGNFLAANISDAEATSGNTVDFLSNGFKIRTAYDGTNNSGSTPIYMAFAENPFVSSKGIPCTAR